MDQQINVKELKKAEPGIYAAQLTNYINKQLIVTEDGKYQVLSSGKEVIKTKFAELAIHHYNEVED